MVELRNKRVGDSDMTAQSPRPPGERAGLSPPRARRRPARLPPKRAKLIGGMDPRGPSGVITVGMADLDASFPDDEGEDDKTGDESRHHPQQEPLVRFHRYPKEGGPRRALFLEANCYQRWPVVVLLSCASDLLFGASRTSDSASAGHRPNELLKFNSRTAAIASARETLRNPFVPA